MNNEAAVPMVTAKTYKKKFLSRTKPNQLKFTVKQNVSIIQVH